MSNLNAVFRQYGFRAKYQPEPAATPQSSFSAIDLLNRAEAELGIKPEVQVIESGAPENGNMVAIGIPVEAGK